MLYAQEERFTLYHGDNREVLKELADNSVDSIVTDPPYELGFMGKSWDASGIAFNVEVWQECLRVLKPGGHLLAFSGSRTYHRMAVAIEDAGFEIRDQIMWIYGSGFPKSLDVSKAIDKAAGAEREITREERRPAETGHPISFDMRSSKERERRDNPATTDAKQWQGWGTALKPAHEPIVVARKPLIGTVAANVLTYGTGGLNIDGARVGSEGGTAREGKANQPNDSGWENMRGHGIAELNAGRWPANVIHDGSDEVVELFPNSKGGAFPAKRGQAVNTAFASGQETEGGFRAMGDDGSAARFFYCAKASKRDRNDGLEGFEEKQTLGGGGLTASMREDGSYETASAGGKYGSVKAKQTNHHPTVKPTDLMRYLCRLITPPNGTVLDPFMGSGSTGKAAVYEKFNFVGIELTDEYLPIAKARIEFALVDESDKLL
jgi:site-specific DNA-methyltransferase (adenine-specific)